MHSTLQLRRQRGLLELLVWSRNRPSLYQSHYVHIPS
uniref:Uncharacterized protein n=1 Tax=Physcomitrium patens TaxID=3218 RepID=A0A2K1JZI1_PHYPA|nr:hypothetical protein PHYPA_014051 [Physcomitrium patens]